MFTVYCVDKYTSKTKSLCTLQSKGDARQEASRLRRVYKHIVVADAKGVIHFQYMDKTECLCKLESVEVI